MSVHRAHIIADELSKALLVAHARKEYSKDAGYTFHLRDAEEKLAELAQRMGYRIEKIEQPKIIEAA